MREPANRRKPPFVVRLLLILSLLLFASIEANPLVRIEAVLGLSPAPLERFFGTKSLFSGMTEGVHQLVRLDIVRSIQANIFSPLVPVLVVLSIATWTFPKIDSSVKECTFFAIFVVLSVVVNLVH
jgi:hypothetical protein